MHITGIIKAHLENRGKSISHLAGLLGEERQNTTRKLSSSSINTDYLERICIALNHDFFADYSTELKKRKKDISHGMVNDPETIYGKTVSYTEYIALLEENVMLNRELRECQSLVQEKNISKPTTVKKK